MEIYSYLHYDLLKETVYLGVWLPLSLSLSNNLASQLGIDRDH